MTKSKEIMIAEMKALGVPQELLSELLKEQFNVGYSFGKKSKDVPEGFSTVLGGRGRAAAGRTIIGEMLHRAAEHEEEQQKQRAVTNGAIQGQMPKTSTGLNHWLNQQSFTVHPSCTEMIKELSQFKWDPSKMDTGAVDASSYALYAVGQWGLKANQVDPRTCIFRKGNWCKRHEYNCNTVRLTTSCEYTVDKENNMSKHSQNDPKWAKALNQHYYDKVKHKGVSQGDIVFVEHPNKEMQGWYIKAKCEDGNVRYNSLNTDKQKQYNCSNLEADHKSTHGTMTHIARGGELMEVMRRMIMGRPTKPQLLINSGVKLQSLKLTKAEKVKPMRDALTEFTARYNHNVAEANRVKGMLEEIQTCNQELAAKMHDIEKSINEVLYE